MNKEQLLHRCKTNEDIAPLVKEILQEADQQLARTIPELTYSLFSLFQLNGDREQYQQIYFGRRSRVNVLTIAYLVTQDDRYAQALNDTLWSICDEYTWSLPAHLSDSKALQHRQQVDLFATETAHMLAEIRFLLGDLLPQQVSERIRDEVEQRVFTPVFDRAEALGWETATHNWSAVCGGAIGMAAMLLEQDEVRLEHMLNRLLLVMDCYLSGYGEDGGCAEGVAYWEYGFGFFFYFADMLREHTQGQINLLTGERLKAIASFPERIHLSGDTFANYSDAPEQITLQPGLLSRLTEHQGRKSSLHGVVPSYHADPCYRWAHLIRNLAWTDLTRFSDDSSVGLSVFHDLSWFIDVRDIGKSVAFTMKGGHNAEPHNHNDIGHLMVHGNGVNLLCDLGYGLYTKEYFGDGRYEVINNSSIGHSVPLINGVGQAEGMDYHAVLLHAEETDTGCSIQLDLSQAYPKEARLQRLIRSCDWSCDTVNKRAELMLVDEFQLQEAGRVEERFVSWYKPSVADGKIIWEAADARLMMRYDSESLEAEVEPYHFQDHGGSLVTCYMTKLRVRELCSAYEIELRLVLE